ncbi:MAG: 5'-nucleotidase C-terminal domain-containing protein [Proteobacteria bacterium]|nr:5'-nucleotidase C-terminal domain-containing protein [Pseudomonadota bacterium]
MGPNRFLVAVLAIAALATPAAADFTLTILHTNDFHSRIEPINKYDSACAAKDAAADKCFGGSARLITAIRARRAAAKNALLVDGGDQFQGSLFYSYYKGKAAAEMMNALGYDAMTVGNHEFDDGPEVLRGFMDAIGFPILLANADISGEPSLAGVLLPATVIEVGGERIGLIGLTPEDTDELASPGPNVTFSDPAEALKREVARLTEAGIDKIVVLSHSGYAVDLRVAASVSGVDVIVGGHSHTYLSNVSEKAAGPYPTWVEAPDGNRVAIVQAYAYGKFLGELNVTWDDAGIVTAATGEPIVMDGQVAEDAALKGRIAELAGPLEEIRHRVVAEAAAVIDGNRESCRVRECEMGNLVADAMLARVKDQGITIAFANGGGLRASIDSGPVTMGEVLTVLPFQNTLSTFKLTGSDVIAALENGVSQVEEVKGRFAQVAGVRYAWTRSVAPNQGRILEVMVQAGGGWAPIDPDKLYGVVANNYVRGGGDGYVVFAESAIDPYDFGPSLDDVVAEYLAAGGAYEPYLDGRIEER